MMATLPDPILRKKVAPTLTRDNYEEWFNMLNLHFRLEGIRYVVQRPWQASTPTIHTPASTTGSATGVDVSLATLSLEEQAEQNKNWDKNDAKAQLLMSYSLDDFDKELVKELSTAYEWWTALKRKYEIKTESQSQQYLVDYVNYRMEPGTTIDEALAKISHLARQAQGVNGFKIDMSAKVQQLIQALPMEYTVTRDAIHVANLTPEEKVRKLKEKEAQLKKESDTAMIAKNNYRPRRRQQSSSPEVSPRRSCFLCENSHLIRDCPYLEFAHDKVMRVQAKEKAARKARKIPVNKRITYPRRGIQKKRKAYDAESDGSDDDTSNSEVETDASDQEPEIANLSKEQICRIPHEKWVADSGASSHMTDQRRLFRTLRPIPKRRILVGGGELFAKFRGDILLRGRNGGEVILKDVYWVPKLGVSLLSGSKMCAGGLRGAFDADELRMLDKNGNTIVKATKSGGVYIVDWVTQMSSYAFYVGDATKIRSDQTPIDIVRRSQGPNKKTSSGGTTQIALDAVVQDEPSQADDDEGSVIVIDQTRSTPRDQFSDTRTKPKSTSLPPQASMDGHQAAEPSSSSTQRYYLKWHRRLGHMGPKILGKIHHIATIKKAITVPKHRDNCISCLLTKAKNRTNRELNERKKEILALASVDIAGPTWTSTRGNKYFLQIVDNHSRKVWNKPIKEREDAPATLESWRKSVELQTGHRVKAIRSDNAPELVKLFDGWRDNDGVLVEYTTPYTSNQNGIAERAIQTTWANSRAMLKDGDVPNALWDYAVETDAYIRNRVTNGPVVNGREVSPEEAYSGKRPSIDHIRRFGCICYSYVNPKSLPKGTRHDKLMDRARPAILLGFNEATDHQYHIWAPDMRAAIRTSVVKWDENKNSTHLKVNLNLPESTNVIPVRNRRGRPKKDVPHRPAELTSLGLPVNGYAGPAAVNVDPNADYIPPAKEALGEVSTEPTRRSPRNWPPATSVEEVPDEGEPQTVFESAPNLSRLDQQCEEPQQTNAPSRDLEKIETVPPAQEIPNSQDQPCEIQEPPKPSLWKFSHVAIPSLKRSYDGEGDEQEAKKMRSLIALAARERKRNAEVDIPVTYKTAVNDPVHGKRWMEAALAEIRSLNEKGTWQIVKRPKDVNIVSSKWVFAVKTDVQGKIERFKARIVARGFSQKFGQDYHNTFAPTVRPDTWRTVLAIAAMEDLEIHQIDVDSAFVNSSLKETIYMEPPQGMDIGEGNVLELRQSLYGLKQAAYEWFQECKKQLLTMGFSQGYSDPCLFIHRDRKLIIMVYVDDLTIVCKILEHVRWFKQAFSERFKIKDLGEISKILGIRITRDRSKRTLTIDQGEYIRKVMKDLNMKQDGHRKTKTIPLNGYDKIKPTTENDEPTDNTRFMSGVGSIMHASVQTRPDITFATGKLSQYTSAPTARHQQGLDEVLRYLRQNDNVGITYGNCSSSDKKLQGYSDSDYGSNARDRKSTLGTVWKIGGGAVAWRSKKQKSVATSTAEAEYVGLSKAAKDAEWFKKLMYDIDYPQYLGDDPYCVEIHGDNQASIALGTNAQLSDSSKHIAIPYHNVQDLISKDKIKLTYVPTKEMAADGLTKPLDGAAFQRFKDLVGMSTVVGS